MSTISTKQTDPVQPQSLLQQKNNRLQKELTLLQENYKKLQEDFEHVINQFVPKADEVQANEIN